MSPIPPAVKKQFDRAQALHKEVTAAIEEPAPAPAPAQADIKTDISEPKTPDPAPQTPDSAPKVTDTKTDIPETTVVPQVPDDSKTVEVNVAAELSKRNAQLSTLQGQLDAEKKRNKEAEDRANARIKKLEDSLKAAPKPVIATPEQVEQYGPEMAAFVQQVAEQAASQAVASKDSEIAELRTHIHKIEADNDALRASLQGDRVETMYDVLQRSVPGWEEQNQLPAFHNWLAELDDVSAVRRQILLETAEKNGDAKRVVAIFQRFRADTGWKPTAAPSTKAKNLDTLASPPGARSGTDAPAVPNAKPTFRQSEVDKFDREMANGTLKRKGVSDKDIQATLRAHSEARLEGRVVR